MSTLCTFYESLHKLSRSSQTLPNAFFLKGKKFSYVLIPFLKTERHDSPNPLNL